MKHLLAPIDRDVSRETSLRKQNGSSAYSRSLRGEIFSFTGRKRSMYCLTLPFFQEIESAQSILLAGAGGGFDIFSGLPLYFGLRAMGKQVPIDVSRETFLLIG